MTALEDLDRLLADPDRHAVLAREVAGSPSSVQRARRKRCADRTLQPISRGIYARSKSKLFDVVPEVLPRLGYTILPARKLTNVNFKHGAKAEFESPRSKLYGTRPVRVTPMPEPPSQRETVRHPWDLSAMRATLALVAPTQDTSLAAMIEEARGPNVTDGLRGLGDPAWSSNYADRAHRMGMQLIADGFFEYADPTWETLRRDVALAALAMDLVTGHDRPEVQGMAEGRWATTGPSA